MIFQVSAVLVILLGLHFVIEWVLRFTPYIYNVDNLTHTLMSNICYVLQASTFVVIITG